MSTILVPVILILNTFVLLFLAWYALIARHKTGSLTFIFVQLCAAIWSTGYAFELFNESLGAKLLFAKLQYFGIAFFPFFWLIFTHQYTGKKLFPSRSWLNILLLLIPVITIALVWTNELHGLIWSSFAPPRPGAFPSLQVQYGTGFWIFIVYSYALQFSGFVVLLDALSKSRESLVRWRLSLMLFAISLPWLLNAVYVFQVDAVYRIDLTPLGFGLTGLVIAVNIFKFHMLGVLPIAYQTVVREIGDVMIILDSQKRVVEINQAGENLFQIPRSIAVGKDVSDVLDGKISFPIEDGLHGFFPWKNAQTGYFDVQVKRLENGLFFTYGWVVLMHDITLEKLQQIQLEQKQEVLERLVAERTESLRQVYTALNDARRFSSSPVLSIESHDPQDDLHLVTARLQEVQEDERKALAVELHDRLGQNLTALGINLRLMQMTLENGQAEQAHEPLLESLGLVNETTRQVRDLLSELRPPALDDLGLFAALQHFSQNVQKRTGLQFDCSGINAAERLAPEVENGLFRIAQEAVTNTVKHARADHVKIMLENFDHTTVMTIQDNGIGFTEEQAKLKEAHHHYGLLTMKERARFIHAETDISSIPGLGTSVKVTIRRQE